MDVFTCIADKVTVDTDVQNNWIPKEQSIIFNTDFVFQWLFSCQYYWHTV